MNIYFARSIRGQHTERDEIVNNIIVSTIKRCGHVPALEMPAVKGNGEPTNRFIYRRDLDWIDRSQAMIAECSNPSLGVGYEIAYAKHVRSLPVLVIARANVRLSAMIAGADIDMFYYGTDENIQTGIEAFLSDVARNEMSFAEVDASYCPDSTNEHRHRWVTINTRKETLCEWCGRPRIATKATVNDG